MKDMALILIILLNLLIGSIPAAAQHKPQKEVLIIGTMHQVPKIVGRSYRPLLKRAIAYDPQAIYVESPPAWDTLSLENTYPGFVAKMDSLRDTLVLDRAQVKRALCRPLNQMTREDFKLLNHYFLTHLDRANAAYYRYLYEYGLAGSPRPTREEDGDLTAKLAIHLGLKSLRSMDNQWYRDEYHRAWAACSQADRQDGEIVHLKKLIKGLGRSQVFAALGRRLGLYTNSEKTTTQYHIINSFRYRETACAPCTEGMELWDARNLQMAHNIGRQVNANPEVRSVVIVGAGHVVGLEEALQREYPEIRVRLLR